jgi:hypothetical protein
MKIAKYIFLGSIFFTGCGQIVTHKDINSSLDSKVGKPYVFNANDKLIKETDGFKEYQTSLSKDCSWIIIVNKKTNIIESWHYSSEQESCPSGAAFYS